MTQLKKLMDLSGRRAVITGGAGHIGRVIADTFAGMGANLVLVDIDAERLSEVGEALSKKNSVEIKTVACDLEFEELRENLAATVLDAGGLNVLVNNAAFVGTSNLSGWAEPFERQTLDTWRRAVEVNLTAAFHLSQLFAPNLRNQLGASIINIGSIYGCLAPDWSLYEGTDMANPAAYGVSKAGLVQLTKYLATSLAPNVRANAISLGGVERGQPEIFKERYINKTPLRRMATEEDLIGAVAFLASDMSSYVTGQTLTVDGGLSTA